MFRNASADMSFSMPPGVEMRIEKALPFKAFWKRLNTEIKYP